LSHVPSKLLVWKLPSSLMRVGAGLCALRAQRRIRLENAQKTKFNDDLGINVDLTWRNASSLSYFVNKLISSSVQGLVTACNARRDYAGVLLATYPFCVNRFFLFQQGGTDFNNVVTYVHLFKHLEFLCSTGFDSELTTQWDEMADRCSLHGSSGRGGARGATSVHRGRDFRVPKSGEGIPLLITSPDLAALS
uniref:Pecanex-like protein n=1 Tax=Heligmosomoides polygyrus TaxID=6339 RepID=A0A183FKA6_HELPZ